MKQCEVFYIKFADKRKKKIKKHAKNDIFSEKLRKSFIKILYKNTIYCAEFNLPQLCITII